MSLQYVCEQCDNEGKSEIFNTEKELKNHIKKIHKTNSYADEQLKKLEKVCLDLGITTHSYNRISNIMKKILKNQTKDIAEEMLSWSIEDLLNEQKILRKQKEEKTELWEE